MINSCLESIGVRKRENWIAKDRKCKENKTNLNVIYVHLITRADCDRFSLLYVKNTRSGLPISQNLPRAFHTERQTC